MKKYKYTFDYAGMFSRVHTSGTVYAKNENEARKELRLWEKFSGIKNLFFHEVVKFSSFNSFETEKAPVGIPMRLVRYGEDKEVIGWLENETIVSVPKEAKKESVSSFKLFKVI